MSFNKYYAELLRLGRKAMPTAEEAQQDYQRTLQAANLTLLGW